MFDVGASLARAFGIVGAANLIRYRAKIAIPRRRRRMLATLSPRARVLEWKLVRPRGFATVFILAVLWVVECWRPERRKTFD
jgi:hypothetical protein